VEEEEYVKVLSGPDSRAPHPIPYTLPTGRQQAENTQEADATVVFGPLIQPRRHSRVLQIVLNTTHSKPYLLLLYYSQA